MTEDEVRAAQYRQSRRVCRANLAAAEAALAGDSAARAALVDRCAPLLPHPDDDLDTSEGCRSLTVANRDCL